jgi:hypothetical protein
MKVYCLLVFESCLVTARLIRISRFGLLSEKKNNLITYTLIAGPRFYFDLIFINQLLTIPSLRHRKSGLK